MNLSEIDLQEFFQELQKNSNLEKIIHNISRLFLSDKRELFEFSVFLFKNNLLCFSEKVMLFLVLYQVSREFPYENHIILIIKTALDYEAKKDEILNQADKLSTMSQSTKDTKIQIQEYLKNNNVNAPEVQSENFILSTVFNDQEPILDNFQMRQEFIIRKDSIFKMKSYCIHEPEFLVPVPEEIPLEFDQLMTPFPLFVETPVINSCTDAEKIIQDLFENISDLDESQQNMLVQLLQDNLSGIKQLELFENLQKLIHRNTELVARIGHVMYKQDQNMFNQYLEHFQSKGDFTLNYLETFNNLLKTCKISQQFLDSFIKDWFYHCMKEEGQNQTKKLKLMCKFLGELIKKDQFDPSSSLDVWVLICNKLKSNRSISELHKLIMNRIHQQKQTIIKFNQL